MDVGPVIARRQSGFTLLELLVVMGLLALMTTVAVYNAPRGRGSAKEEAERFAARIIAAETVSLGAGAPLRVEFTPEGYSFLEYVEGGWRPLKTSRVATSRDYGRDVTVLAQFGDPALKNEPKTENRESKTRSLIIDPIGLGQSFALVFVDGRERWRVSGGAGGRVKVEPDGER